MKFSKEVIEAVRKDEEADQYTVYKIRRRHEKQNTMNVEDEKK